MEIQPAHLRHVGSARRVRPRDDMAAAVAHLRAQVERIHRLEEERAATRRECDRLRCQLTSERATADRLAEEAEQIIADLTQERNEARRECETLWAEVERLRAARQEVA